MSDSGPIDLGDLQIKPQWVDELDKPSTYKSFDAGDIDRLDQLSRGRDRRSGGGGGGGNRSRSQRGPGGGGGGGDRQRRDRSRRDDRPRGDRPQRPRGDRREGGGQRRQGHGNRSRNFEPRPQRPPLYELIDIDLVPDALGLQAVAKQIKMTGRSYPIFDLARLVLGGPERFHARFQLKPETTQVQLIECRMDGSVWLSMNEALRHFRTSPLFEDYYKKEEVDVGPPKGNFSVIAVCGLSGTLLGPPNFHAYQKNVSDLHHRRFSRMHIDTYKRKIQMVRDEETLEKWRNSLSKEVHYTYIKGPEGEESPVFKSTRDAEKHFVEHHGKEQFVEVQHTMVAGNISPKLMSGALHNMMVRTAERQQRFPMPMVKNLSPMLEEAGLKFFKIGKKSTFVARSRPRPFDPQAGGGASPRVQSIVRFIRDNPGNDLHRLVSTLAPNGAATESNEPTPEEVDILKDLRWLIREGYVIEFSNGELLMAGDRRPAAKAKRDKGPKQQPSQKKERPAKKAKATTTGPKTKAGRSAAKRFPRDPRKAIRERILARRRRATKPSQGYHAARVEARLAAKRRPKVARLRRPLSRSWRRACCDV